MLLHIHPLEGVGPGRVAAENARPSVSHLSISQMSSQCHYQLFFEAGGTSDSEANNLRCIDPLISSSPAKAPSARLAESKGFGNIQIKIRQGISFWHWNAETVSFLIDCIPPRWGVNLNLSFLTQVQSDCDSDASRCFNPKGKAILFYNRPVVSAVWHQLIDVSQHNPALAKTSESRSDK